MELSTISVKREPGVVPIPNVIRFDGSVAPSLKNKGRTLSPSPSPPQMSPLSSCSSSPTSGFPFTHLHAGKLESNTNSASHMDIQEIMKKKLVVPLQRLESVRVSEVKECTAPPYQVRTATSMPSTVTDNKSPNGFHPRLATDKKMKLQLKRIDENVLFHINIKNRSAIYPPTSVVSRSDQEDNHANQILRRSYQTNPEILPKLIVNQQKGVEEPILDEPHTFNKPHSPLAWRGVTVESVSNIIRFTPGLKYKRMVVELESPNDMSESENETITVSQTLRRAYEQELPPTPMPPVKRRRGRPKKQCLPMTAVQPPMHRR